MCVCARACVCVCVRVCVRVCVIRRGKSERESAYERERARESKREPESERARAREREQERARERKSESKRARARERERERERQDRPPGCYETLPILSSRGCSSHSHCLERSETVLCPCNAETGKRQEWPCHPHRKRCASTATGAHACSGRALPRLHHICSSAWCRVQQQRGEVRYSPTGSGFLGVPRPSETLLRENCPRARLWQTLPQARWRGCHARARAG